VCLQTTSASDVRLAEVNNLWNNKLEQEYQLFQAEDGKGLSNNSSNSSDNNNNNNRNKAEYNA
jgi:hypothetical protein